MSLISVAEAQARILALAPDAAIETVALGLAAGRWAAHDVVARRTQPAADLSAMDGYAVRHADLPGPWRVVGQSAAGTGLDRRIDAGEAARIFTGAPLPDGTDTILIQEDGERDGDCLRLTGDGPAERGAFVRLSGSDFRDGQTLIAAGAPLTPPRIALAALGGHAALPVRHHLRVALLSTGNELVAPGARAEGSRLPACNAAMLAAMLGGLPVEIEDHGIVADELTALTTAMEAAAGADVLVTTGGASVGDHDLVRPALETAGATIDFWRVAMKPGKPLMAGRLRDTTVLGLPGNPVSAYVTALLFLLPMLRHAMGAAQPFARCRVAHLAAALPATGPRAEFIRGQRNGDSVRPLAGQDSAMLRTLSEADTLIMRAPQAPAAAAGDEVDIIDIA